jgi:hypothetical protein
MSRIKIVNIPRKQSGNDMELEEKLKSLGIKKYTMIEYGKALQKNREKGLDFAWVEVVNMREIGGGWRVSLHVETVDTDLLIKITEKLNNILEELRTYGYS